MFNALQGRAKNVMRFAESEATQGKTNEETVRKPFGTLLNVMGERETFYFLSVSQ